jgi:hypothetical protein
MARRKFNVFSLSFLDCICCGFGAVILLFVLMNARSSAVREERVQDLRGEVNLVEIEVLNLERERVLARNALDELIEEIEETQGLSREVLTLLEETREELAQFEEDTLATEEHVNQLKADLLSLEEGLKRLQAGAEAEAEGEALRMFRGDGRRQYLTGLQLRGERTLILVDISASMLAENLVDVLRIRNLPADEQQEAPKWVQVRRTVEWLLANLPAEGQFQIAVFHNEVRSLRSDTGWWSAADPGIRDEAADALEAVVPSSGSSLHLAFDWASGMNPLPDNIILLTDSLPTMDRRPPALRRTVTGTRRWQLFQEAVRIIPSGIPVNTMLFYLEGDPSAAIAYWRLAVDTRGSMLTVAKDWP